MQRWIRDRHRVLGIVLISGGLLLVPWLMYLSVTLPMTTRARNWALMWVGIDVAEAIGMITTGILQLRRDGRRALTATFTSALLFLDAWVDVTTSAPGHARVVAWVLAVALEVPAAIACLYMALANFASDSRRGRRPNAAEPYLRPIAPDGTLGRDGAQPPGAAPPANAAPPLNTAPPLSTAPSSQGVDLSAVAHPSPTTSRWR